MASAQALGDLLRRPMPRPDAPEPLFRPKVGGRSIPSTASLARNDAYATLSPVAGLPTPYELSARRSVGLIVCTTTVSEIILLTRTCPSDSKRPIAWFTKERGRPRASAIESDS